MSFIFHLIITCGSQKSLPSFLLLPHRNISLPNLPTTTSFHRTNSLTRTTHSHKSLILYLASHQYYLSKAIKVVKPSQNHSSQNLHSTLETNLKLQRNNDHRFSTTVTNLKIRIASSYTHNALPIRSSSPLSLLSLFSLPSTPTSYSPKPTFLSEHCYKKPLVGKREAGRRRWW